MTAFASLPPSADLDRSKRPKKLALLLASVILSATSAMAERPAIYSLKDSPQDGYLDILRDGRIAGRYMYAYEEKGPKRVDTNKPYLHVYDPSGSTPLTKGPGGLFPHHRGIFVGWNKIEVNGKTYDRWHMQGGSQIHQKFSEQKADTRGARVTSIVNWTGGPGETIVEEKRVMTFLPAPSPAYSQLDVVSTLKAVAGDTKFGGDLEHAGLQFRANADLDTTKTKYLYPVKNAKPGKDLDYPWVVESITLADEAYHVIYLNHPSNPKETVFSANRDYGRFGAFFEGSAAKGKEFVVKARFLFVEGERPSAEWIQKQANVYTGTTLPTPETTEKQPPATQVASKPADAVKPEVKTES